MFAILEAKLPPPKPHNKANTAINRYGVSVFCTAKPIQTDGNSNEAVLIGKKGDVHPHIHSQ